MRGVAAESERMFGMQLEELIDAAREAEHTAEELIGDGTASAERRLPIVLRFAE